MFSLRTSWNLQCNAFSQRSQELRQRGLPLIDLTESNPTRVGLSYPSAIASSLSEEGVFTYWPDPKGDLAARQAVASIYQKKGFEVGPEEILLAASTSQAYDFLFRLLTNPGDRILVPTPSYPLLSYLADLNDVKVQPYPLRYDSSRWRVDFEALALAAEKKSAVLVVVHPNNPTGSGLTDEERIRIIQLCKAYSIALISDEVFADYLWEEASLPATLAGDPEILTFALGGLSKFMGLPQMKLAWIAASGPRQARTVALERLQVVADTYLSVNTPVQKALPLWLQLADEIQTQIRRRLAQNRQWLLSQTTEASGLQMFSSDGGWSAVIRIPSVEEGEGWALKLLEKEQVLIHPGYLFDFEEENLFVMSLLTPPDLFREGVRRLLAAIP